MSDPETLRAHAALDGELDASQQIAFEQELQRSPELAAEYQRLRALKAAIREHAPREAAPEALRARIEALAGAPPRRSRAPIWPALAAGVALAAALAGYGAGRAGGGDPELAALVAGYQRAALSGQPIDVASSDRHTVKPWLAARTPVGVQAPDLADDGFPLVGGRIDIVDARPVPTLVYRRREHLISVTELALSSPSGGAATLEGYHVLRWRDRERAYVAISDLDASELQSFAADFAKRTP
jgi:anti-sigma factor RsiW